MTLLQRDLQNREEGLAEGLVERRMQIVLNMYSTGMTPEKIAELTVLSLDEVIELLKKYRGNFSKSSFVLKERYCKRLMYIILISHQSF